MAEEEHFTAFDVEEHGFHFGNSFSLEKILEEMKIGYAIPVNLSELPQYKSWNVGLCSGMCWAALDRYFRKETIPDIDTPPQSGDLFKELVRRNHNAYKWGVTVAKVLAYQVLNDDGTGIRDSWSLGYKTQINEWPKIKAKLKAGIPVTMVLITQGITDLWNPTSISNNHAVVAIGYRYDSETKKVKIYAYDPNKHDNRVRISFYLEKKHHALSIKHDERNDLRGFFYNSYDGQERLIKKGEKFTLPFDQRLIDLSWFWVLWGST